MAFEVVGGAFLSSAFQTLFEKMASPEVVGFFREKKLNEGLLKKLEIVLVSANAVLDDAEGKQLRNSTVRKWLDELKDATFDAEDLLDAIATEALQREIKGASSSRKNKVRKLVSTNLFSSSAFEKEIEAKIEEILDRLKFVLDQKQFLGLKEADIQNRVSKRLLVTSLVDESGVFGRDADKEKIVKLLLSNDVNCNKISVIPIVGMGGIGKTTLAQLVYNDDAVKNHFDVKAWVTVSDVFDIPRITKTILGNVTKSQACDYIKDFNLLQIKLKEALTGKKFFFVLDGVWNKNYVQWNDLRRAFESGAQGSKIIVTTRDAKIASMMSNVPAHRLGIMSNEDCWSLFAKHAFDNVPLGAYQNFEIIGRKIVQKCQGLPLAVKSLAGLLRSEPNVEEWEKIVKSDIWELSNEEIDILPALWLSYKYLPPHLKRCFSYCSIFPKDFEFQKEKLILLWKAENLLPHQKNRNVEEVGEECFDYLVSRSLFQHAFSYSVWQDFKRGDLFRMHDLMNDLAKFVSREFCLVLGNNESNTARRNGCRHLSYVGENTYDFKVFEALSQAKSLRTFLALESVAYKFPQRGQNKLPYEILQTTLLSTTQSLRVLSLFCYAHTELPDSIANLKHLRYLDLSRSKLKKLPDTVCCLQNLQILLLTSCENLTQLPVNIGSLINLQHLDIRGTPLKDMPQDLCDLKNLQILSDFVLGQNSRPNINQLKKLQNLRGELCISGLENIVDVDDISETILKDMKYVSELFLKWSGDIHDSDIENVVLDKLQPHIDLKRLLIDGYEGTRFPHWLGDSSFLNITRMMLKDCKRCRFLPPLGQLPSLREVLISGFDELESIGEEFYSTSEPFRSLQQLWIERCEQLVTLVSGASQQTHDTVFPSLEVLFIHGCPRMESFLERGTFARLQHLNIINCEKLFALRMQWDLHRFPSLTSFSIGDRNVVDSFPDEGLLPISLTYLFIGSCGNLKALNGKSFQQLTSLKQLRFVCCDVLECLPEEGLPTSLSFLEIYECPLLSGRCQREIGEDWPKIAHISNIRSIEKWI